MGLLDGLLKNVAGAPDDVANLAAKVGIDPALAEKAIAALGKAHQEPGNTVDVAAARTGLDAGVLTGIVQQIGGEGALGEFARMLNEHPQAKGLLDMLDRNGDGNPFDDLAGMAGKFFKK